MDMNLKGFKHYHGETLMGGVISYNNRLLCEHESRILVNYGIAEGYEKLSDIPEEVVREVCEKHGHAEWMKKYDDTPEFISMDKLKGILMMLSGCWYNNFDGEDIYKQIEEELNEDY